MVWSPAHIDILPSDGCLSGTDSSRCGVSLIPALLVKEESRNQMQSSGNFLRGLPLGNCWVDSITLSFGENCSESSK